jgi:hypothetical protein
MEVVKMRNIEKFKKTLLMSLLAIVVLAMLPLNIVGEPDGEVSSMSSNSKVSIHVNGVAVRKIDEKNERMRLTMDLTLELGVKRKNLIPVKSVTGTIKIGENSYSVDKAEGVILLERNVILLRLSCDGRSITLALHIKYFWMGGGLYAVRGTGALNDEAGRMLTIFRGTARLS